MLLEGLKLNYTCEAPMLSQKGSNCAELRELMGKEGKGRKQQP